MENTPSSLLNALVCESPEVAGLMMIRSSVVSNSYCRYSGTSLGVQLTVTRMVSPALASRTSSWLSTDETAQVTASAATVSVTVTFPQAAVIGEPVVVSVPTSEIAYEPVAAYS